MSAGTPVPEGFWRAYHEQARIDGIPATAETVRNTGSGRLGNDMSFEDTLFLLEKRWTKSVWSCGVPWPEFLQAVITRMHEENPT